MLAMAKSAPAARNVRNTRPRRDARAWFIRLCSQQSPPQSEAVESEVKRRNSSYVQGQHSAKNLGTLTKNLENTPLKLGAAVERNHQSRHQQRAPRQAAVRLLIPREIARTEATRQHRGLTEGKAETLACNGIHGAC